MRRPLARPVAARPGPPWVFVVLLAGCPSGTPGSDGGSSPDAADTIDAAIASGEDGGPDAWSADTVDAGAGDATGGAYPLCQAACEIFNAPSGGCGASNFDCRALCAESASIASATTCVAETDAFWACTGRTSPSAVCSSEGFCRPEQGALDACVAMRPSSNCLRACVACGSSSYGTCAIGCARRDGHARAMGCVAEYEAYYTCQLASGSRCDICSAEQSAFSACWAASCRAGGACPVVP